MRLFAIAILSVFSMILALSITHGLLGLSNDTSSIISMIVAIIITPSILLYFWKAKPGLEALPVDPADPIMIKQVERSKNELARFLNGLDQGSMEAYVKFPMLVGDSTEHVWAVAHSHSAESVVVSLASTPVGGVTEEMLNRMSIPLKNVEDWMLQDSSGKMYGGYTMLALAEIYQREYGKLPNKIRKNLGQFVDFSLDGLV